jgi:hypothetical protein
MGQGVKHRQTHILFPHLQDLTEDKAAPKEKEGKYTRGLIFWLQVAF